MAAIGTNRMSDSNQRDSEFGIISELAYSSSIARVKLIVPIIITSPTAGHAVELAISAHPTKRANTISRVGLACAKPARAKPGSLSYSCSIGCPVDSSGLARLGRVATADGSRGFQPTENVASHHCASRSDA